MWINDTLGGPWGMDLYLGVFWVLVVAAAVAMVMMAVRGHAAGTQDAAHRKTARVIAEGRDTAGGRAQETFRRHRRDR